MVPVITRPEYDVHCEYYPNLGVFMHVTMREWSKDVFLGTLLDLDDLMTGIKEHGQDTMYAPIGPTDKKLQKFATMYGFYETDLVLQDEDENIIAHVWAYKED